MRCAHIAHDVVSTSIDRNDVIRGSRQRIRPTERPVDIAKADVTNPSISLEDVILVILLSLSTQDSGPTSTLSSAVRFGMKPVPLNEYPSRPLRVFLCPFRTSPRHTLSTAGDQFAIRHTEHTCRLGDLALCAFLQSLLKKICVSFLFFAIGGVLCGFSNFLIRFITIYTLIRKTVLASPPKVEMFNRFGLLTFGTNLHLLRFNGGSRSSRLDTTALRLFLRKYPCMLP